MKPVLSSIIALLVAIPALGVSNQECSIRLAANEILVHPRRLPEGVSTGGFVVRQERHQQFRYLLTLEGGTVVEERTRVTLFETDALRKTGKSVDNYAIGFSPMVLTVNKAMIAENGMLGVEDIRIADHHQVKLIGWIRKDGGVSISPMPTYFLRLGNKPGETIAIGVPYNARLESFLKGSPSGEVFVEVEGGSPTLHVTRMRRYEVANVTPIDDQEVPAGQLNVFEPNILSQIRRPE